MLSETAQAHQEIRQESPNGAQEEVKLTWLINDGAKIVTVDGSNEMSEIDGELLYTVCTD